MYNDYKSVQIILKLLNSRDKKVLLVISLLQILVNALDLIGIALIGMIGSLSIRGVQSQSAGNRVGKILEFLGLQEKPLQIQVVYLGSLAVLMLVSRTLISMFLAKRTLFFLSRRGTQVSSKLYEKILNENILQINKRQIQLTIYALGSGVTNLILGVIAIIPSLLSDISLLLLLFISLTVVDPILTILSFVLFAFIALFVHKFLYLRVSNLGSEYTLETMKSNNLIEQTLTSFREITVRNQLNDYLVRFVTVRNRVSNMDASLRFMPNISKYVIEVAIILSAILFSAYQFIRFDASVAIGTLSLFLAALMRIGPAFLRIQQSVLSMKNSLATSQESLLLIKESQNIEMSKESQIKNLTSPEKNRQERSFSGNVVVENLTYSYDKNRDILKNLTCTFAEREITAIVGVSGSGKSTFMDLMLGVLELQSGKITISNEMPIDAIKNWPGKITYVPQETKIYDGTIRENILLGMSPDYVSDLEIDEIINLVQLSNFIENQSLGIYSQVGERGTSLSGGQKQRIGLARGLITKPELVFLDEATSALDGQTEFQLTEEIKSLKKNATVVMIAHRLTTVKIADKVLYLTANGNIGYFGSSNEFFQKLGNNEFENFIMN